MSDSLLTRVPEGVRLHIRLTPKASADKLDRVDKDADGMPRLRATVTAIPENGKANAALIKLLSKKLRLPKSAIRLIAGDQNRNKTILFEGAPVELFDALDAKLRELGLLG
ncbi:DUF167 domain-containing protein [Kordiimonas lipolytica]|uniref:UPF0235 protein ACFO5Q_00975 n=1 Tax=Kordiimonas lipolytica TaxID=1662421 RepID=A0ABV8U5L2_9PROT|nr:DUF167 family protein [Kordiimonas lipolytica]